MSKFFGKTWWGQQWLKALSNIDYGNRLPRGSRYARNGSIKSLEISGNQIIAKVQGSLRTPYKILIEVPLFSRLQIEELVSTIASRPILVSRLLNKELDPDILAISKQLRIKVFAEKWNDIVMRCNCPDDAVPCKHIAAVIYKVCDEIDNNPFLVFNLHGVDLSKELEKLHIFIKPDQEDDIPALSDFFLQQTLLTNKKTTDSISSQFQSIHFSELKEIGDSLMQLLSESPAFYKAKTDFKSIYFKALHSIRKDASSILANKRSFEDFLPPPVFRSGKAQTQKETEITITEDTSFTVFIDGNNQLQIKGTDPLEGVSVKQLAIAIWNLPSTVSEEYHQSVVALRTSLFLSLNLIAKGAIIPKIVRMASQDYGVIWTPAFLSNEVLKVTTQVDALFTSGTVSFTSNTSNDKVVNPSIVLISHWIALFIKHSNLPKEDEKIFNLFFKSQTDPFHQMGERALPGGIHAWLGLYHLSQVDFKPMIIVEEIAEMNFSVEVRVLDKIKPNDHSISISELFTSKKFEKNRFDVLQSLAHITTFIPNLDQHINILGEKPIVLDTGEFTPFLLNTLPIVKLLGINVLLPKSLQTILKPKPTVKLKKAANDGKSFIRLDQLLEFDWQIAIGDTIINETEFLKLVRNSHGLIKYKENYIYADPSDIEKLHKHFSTHNHLTKWELLQIAISEDYYGSRIVMSDEVRDMLDKLATDAPETLPKALNASLRPYQERGFSWLVRNAKLGFGAVLADDMGLGKTLQVITTILKIKEEGGINQEKVLIVVPTGLLSNWQAEIEKFAPSLVFKVYHGSSRVLDKKDHYDILLTSYGIMRNDAAKLKKLKWQLLVIDEAQNIKNQATAQSKALKGIPAHTFIAMSGTPVENRLSELWSIMDYSNRGLLGTDKDFAKRFGTPIQNENNFEAAEKLKKVTAPFLMRRLKSDKSIICDLPEKIEINSYGSLVKTQASLYESTLQKALAQIEGIDENDQNALFKRQGLVLQMIMALKQICNHPTQFLKNNVLDASLSGKMELLYDKLESIIESNEKVLVFTQFTEMGHLMKHFIQEKFGIDPLFYHGGNTIKQRKEMVDSFQNNRTDKIFILSLKAAGTGLNLTAANHVIHYDLWWNPAVEAQATDRAYRIGQKKNVMVHRFITKGTFEEKINAMIQGKKALADLTVATGENWIGNLSNAELKQVFERSE